MRKKLLNKNVVFLLTLVFTFSLCFIGGYKAKATQDKPDVKITVTTNKSSALVNEEIEIKYRIEPQPINIEDINEKKNKEIILVVDTSGSMNDKLERKKTRIQALKEAAKNFISKFKDEDNVKIGIVSYNYSGEQSIALISSKEQKKLDRTINNLSAKGATNIGDGIRVAANMFSKDTSVKKYLVLMSDGMPTSLSYKGEAGGYAHDQYGKPIYNYYYGQFGNIIYDYCYDYDYDYGNNSYYWLPEDLYKGYRTWSYYNIDDTDRIRYGTYGSHDPQGYCLEYSKLMAVELKKNNIINYVIGFSGGSDSTKLIQIAESGGGTYYDARDAEAINEVYSKIGDQIKADYAVEDVKLNFNLPEGMECTVNNNEVLKEGNGYIKSIPNIIYRLNDKKTQYIADPFDIIIKIKTNKSGNYTLGGDWQLVYKGINNNNVVKNLPKVNITINKYNMDFDVSRKLLPDNNSGQFNINKEFEIEYTVIPKAISAEISQQPKEIMLVVDTSGSMLYSIEDNYEDSSKPSRMDLTKNALKDFVDKFKNIKDVKIGITSYIDEATIYNFGTEDNPQYFTEASNVDKLNEVIEGLTSGGATNIGEGMRKALWSLSLNKDYNKYLVLMSDGEPSHYTCMKSIDNFYTEINNDNFNSEHSYKFDWDKALEYSKLVASMVKENKDLDIKTFAIGFSKGADSSKLQEIAKGAEGTYFDATASDKDAISKVYMGIADKIKADFTLDSAKLNQGLPEGFTIVGSEKGSFSKDLKVNYVYNNEKKQYEAEPIKFKIKVMPSKMGNYQLDNDAYFSYNDLEGVNHIKKFNPLSISIIDDYVVKQGLFQKDEDNKGNYPGENNIKYLDSINIVSDNLTRLGAFIRTSGQQTNLNISINPNMNADIKKLYDVNVNVYRVNNDGKLDKINVPTTIEGSNGNFAKMVINLPRENTDGYSYYVVNYDFKVNTNSKTDVNMISRCEIVGTDRCSDLNVRIGELPDLF